MKQAYLIIAHNKIEQLKFLVSLLDYKEHDIFILFDEKARISSEEKIKLAQVAKSSKIVFAEEIPIYWGDYSQIQAEMTLFKTASTSGDYSLYHLLSGVDLPLETAENLYHFFDHHREYNFLSVATDQFSKQMRREERIAFYHIFPRLNHRTVRFKSIGYCFAAYRKLENAVQRLLKINKIAKYNVKVKNGSNWCSLNQKAVDTLMREESFIEELFKTAVCGDEMFVPMMLEKNGMMGTLYSNQNHGNLRYIEWTRGNYGFSPYTWKDTDEDIEKLKQSKQDGYLFSERKGSLFARKFDLEQYPHMKERIKEVIVSKANAIE